MNYIDTILNNKKYIFNNDINLKNVFCNKTPAIEVQRDSNKSSLYLDSYSCNCEDHLKFYNLEKYIHEFIQKGYIKDVEKWYNITRSDLINMKFSNRDIKQWRLMINELKINNKELENINNISQEV